MNRKRRREDEPALSDSDSDGGDGNAFREVQDRKEAGPAPRADDFIPMGESDPEVAGCSYEPFPEDEWWAKDETDQLTDYCYFCHVYSGPEEKNEFRDRMTEMIKSLCTRMDLRALCQYVARYHRNEVQAYDEEDKECSAATIYRHFTDHEIVPQLLTADFLRTTKRYHHLYKQTAVRKDTQGKPLPPDSEHVKNHLKVMQLASALCTRLSKASDTN